MVADTSDERNTLPSRAEERDSKGLTNGLNVVDGIGCRGESNDDDQSSCDNSAMWVSCPSRGTESRCAEPNRANKSAVSARTPSFRTTTRSLADRLVQEA